MGEANQTCPRCGDDHEATACPYVQAVDFDVDGNILRLEFLTPADYGANKEPAKQEAREEYARLGDRPPAGG